MKGQYRRRPLEKLIEKISMAKEREEVNLLCIPYAGGGASAYYAWKKRLNSKVGLYAVQLPGRENRIVDTPYESIHDMIPDLLEEMDVVVQKPYILFGHSMGAKVAYELEKAMALKAMGSVELIVSGSRAPHIPEPKPIGHLPDEAFLKELYRFEGTPVEVLQNKEIMKLFLPLLKTNFTMDEEYYDVNKKKVNCPITAFCGKHDVEANEEDMRQWKDYSDLFTMKVFDGNHFFIKSELIKVLDMINEIASKYLKS